MIKKVLSTTIICMGMLSGGLANADETKQVQEMTAPAVISESLTVTAPTPADLRVWGPQNAETTLYLFSSFTCPHCSVFHKEVLSDIMEGYVKTGKVKLVSVDMPYDSLAMTATLMSRCIGESKYDDYVKILFENQSTWTRNEKPRAFLENTARMLGADMNKLKACIYDAKLQRKVTDQRNNLSSLYKVTGMPTLVIVKSGESQKISGTDTVAIMEKIKSVVGE